MCCANKPGPNNAQDPAVNCRWPKPYLIFCNNFPPKFMSQPLIEQRWSSSSFDIHRPHYPMLTISISRRCPKINPFASTRASSLLPNLFSIYVFVPHRKRRPSRHVFLRALLPLKIVRNMSLVYMYTCLVLFVHSIRSASYLLNNFAFGERKEKNETRSSYVFFFPQTCNSLTITLVK